MAKRNKIDGWEEIKKLIQEEKLFIPHVSKYLLEQMGDYYSRGYNDAEETISFARTGDDIPEGSPVYMGDDKKAYTWKTTRVEAKARTIDPKTALLEAEAGEDGIFRIEGEGLQEEYIEQIARQIAEAHKGIQEEINRLILGMFNQDDPRYKKYRE